MLLRVSIAKAGEDVSRCPEFSKPEVTIGRRPTNDVILPDDGVSGLHAKLLVTGNTLTLVDQGSTNGTFVGAERLEGPHTIGSDDEVLIGDYRLSFRLGDGAAAGADAGRAPQTVGPDAIVPLSSALGWADDEVDLPPPPPMLDDAVGVTPSTPPRLPSVPVKASNPNRERSTRASPASATPLARAKPPGSAGPGRVEAGFAFDPHCPQSLHEQVFAAVWVRVARDVVTARPGTTRRVKQLIEQAVEAASKVGPLASGIGEQIAEEMLTTTVMETLLKGEPDEILVLGTQGVRIDRGGHVSRGPSPLSCVGAVVALASQLCGAVVDRARPIIRQTYGGYAVQALHGSVAGGMPTISLRRVPKTKPSSLKELEAAGSVTPLQSHILQAALRHGLQVVMCVGPGVDARLVLSALLGAGPSNELQVVVAPAGVDRRDLRAGTVLINREPSLGDPVEAALRLRPTRLALEDIPWGDGVGLDALTSSSVRMLASVRARHPWVALRRLASMLDEGRGARGGSMAFLAASIDLLITVGASRDGSPRILGLTEPLIAASGEVELSDLVRFDPQTQTWVAALGSSPCLDDLVHRGFLDPRVLSPNSAAESTG